MRGPALLAALVLVLSAGTAHAQVSRVPAPPTGAAPRPGAPRAPSIFVHAGGGVGLPSSVAYDITFFDNVEDAPFTVGVNQPVSPTIDAGVWYRLARSFGVGVSVTARSISSDATIDGELPHPFYFDQPRAITGEISDVKTSEVGVHVELVVPVRFGGLSGSVFGGPSFFVVQHDVLDGVNYFDDYPYDSVEFSSASTATAEGRGIGFNAGAEIGKALTPKVDLAGRVRYLAGTVDLEAPEETIPFKITGLLVTVGVRLSF